MGVFDSELRVLPGVTTEIISVAQTTYDTTQWDTTDSLVVIGTAFNGPTGVLVPVWCPEHARYIFGGTYDSTTKTEVDLVAGVQEAWDNGCRTIYCVRLGGKDLYKDFDMCLSGGYKLRVSSMYPTNSGKQAYILYDNTDGAETLTFYKIPDRATILERNNGLVESMNEMLSHSLLINQDYGYTKDSPLVDMINLFNDYSYNNVLRLSIIDKNGTDITATPEAYSIPIGALFPGIYFIGRSKNAAKMPIKTSVTTNLVFDETDTSKLPYETFEGNYYVTLNVNTDITAAYPIYGTTKTLREALANVGISMIEPYDFLDVVGSSNKAFPEDDVDYEETGLTNFEKYQRLGKGFAITAHLEKRTDSQGNELTPKVVETKSTDTANRVVGIEDGLYAMLQDAPINYRVLGALIPADATIGGKLPKPSAFKVAIPNEISLAKLDGGSSVDSPYLFTLSSIADKDDVTSPVKDYRFKFMSFYPSEYPELTSTSIYSIQTFTLLPMVEKVDEIDLSVDNGTKVLVGTVDSAKLYEIIDGVATEVGSDGYDDGTSHTRYAVTVITDTKDDNGDVTTTDVEHYLVQSSQDSSDTSKMTFKKLTLTTNPSSVVGESIVGSGIVGESASGIEGLNNEDSTDPTLDLGDAKYILINMNNTLYVWYFNSSELIPCADFDTMRDPITDEEESMIYIYAESLPMGTNFVQVGSPYFDIMTVSDFVDELNDNDIFNTYFEIALTTQGSVYKDDYMKGSGSGEDHVDGAADDIIDTGIIDFGNDRDIQYDYNSYIPYRTTDNFARQLAQHCTYSELKTARTHGFIGVERITDMSLTNIANKVSELVDFNFDLYAKKNNGRNLLDSNNSPVNVGRTISVVCIPEYVTNDTDSYSFLSSGAAAYAGIVSQLEITRSSTMYGTDITPLFDFTHSQLESLTTVGIITVRNSYTKGYAITDGTTMADSDDIMKRLNVARIAGAVEDVIRSSAEPYIGKQNTLENRNAMETAITSGFKSLQENGLISSYDFTILDDSTADYYTYVNIDYEIVPIGEIRNVHNTISIRANAS